MGQGHFDHPVQQILEDAAARWPNHTALNFMGRRISYAELEDLANRAATGLQKLGVGPGIHVGLYLANTPHYLIALFGALKAGGTVVNYSPLDAAKVLEHKIEDSQTDFLITLDVASLYPQMAPMLDSTRLKKLIVGNVAEMSGNPEAVHAQMQATKQLANVPSDDRHVTFRSLLDNDGIYRSYSIADLSDAIALLQYTGGTTGLPKGAMLTHANLTAATNQCIETTRTEPPTLEEARSACWRCCRRSISMP